MSTEPLVVIPARLASSRLPGKPLKKIGNKTLIEHCVDSARKAGVEPYVVTDSAKIGNLFRMSRVGIGDDPTIETGTDRIAQAVGVMIGWDNAPDWIINVQGDMPFGTAPFIKAIIDATKDDGEYVEMITPFCEIETVDVKYGSFWRSKYQHHVGIYAYRKEALKFFYDYRNDSELRQDEVNKRLEQVRAIELRIPWKMLTVDALPPLEVNTQADLDRINEIVNTCAGLGNPGFTADEAASLALAGGG